LVIPNGFFIHHNYETEIYEERAVLVGIITQTQNEERAREYLDELAFLADTAELNPKSFFQRLDYPNPKTFVGPGKLQEIGSS
jgi:GTP-binding protein HflX